MYAPTFIILKVPIPESTIISSLLNITNLNRMMVNKVNPPVTKPCFIINLFIITSTHSHLSD